MKRKLLAILGILVVEVLAYLFGRFLNPAGDQHITWYLLGSFAGFAAFLTAILIGIELQDDEGEHTVQWIPTEKEILIQTTVDPTTIDQVSFLYKKKED